LAAAKDADDDYLSPLEVDDVGDALLCDCLPFLLWGRGFRWQERAAFRAVCMELSEVDPAYLTRPTRRLSPSEYHFPALGDIFAEVGVVHVLEDPLL
tara:strand:- start:271 stop:561 length:291 start_codon:yes stop_codon:yes gene_type:complete